MMMMMMMMVVVVVVMTMMMPTTTFKPKPEACSLLFSCILISANKFCNRFPEHRFLFLCPLSEIVHVAVTSFNYLIILTKNISVPAQNCNCKLRFSKLIKNFALTSLWEFGLPLLYFKTFSYYMVALFYGQFVYVKYIVCHKQSSFRDE